MVALRLMLPVVGCSVLYVLRFAGGPEGNMPTTFCCTTPVDNTHYVRNEANMHWVHAVICVKNVTKQGSMHCVCVCVCREDLQMSCWFQKNIKNIFRRYSSIDKSSLYTTWMKCRQKKTSQKTQSADKLLAMEALPSNVKKIN